MVFDMRIVVLEGSPNEDGSTHILADCFRQGAEGAGHTVELIDVGHADIHPWHGTVMTGPLRRWRLTTGRWCGI